MRAATEGSLAPVMPQGNLVEVLGREVREGSPGELMVESTPSRQRRPPCKTNKEMSDEAADAAALTYLLFYHVTVPPMRVLHHSGAHHTPFVQLPEWPQYRLFHQYLTQTARAAGHTLPGSKDMQAAYRDFEKQHPRPIPAKPPYAPTGSKHKPAPWVAGPVPPLTLLLAPNEAKPTQTTVIRQGAKWRITKHHMTAGDVPKIPHDSQSMPRTCWTSDPEAPATPRPVLHLIARHHTQPTTHFHHKRTHG